MSLISHAMDAHRKGKIGEAEELYRRVSASDPHNFDALHMLGVIYSDLGRAEDAERSFHRALAIDPNFPPCYHNFGLFYLKRGRFEQAIAQFDKALALFPSYAPVYSDRGSALLQLGRTDEALQSLHRAVALAPNAPNAWYNRGAAHLKLRQYELALNDFERARSLNPRYAEAWFGLGEVLFNIERYPEAISAFEQATGLKADFAEAWCSLGGALAKSGRTSDAFGAYDKALSIRSEHAPAIAGRAHLLSELRRYSEALPEYERALQIEPGLTSGWHGLGNAYYELNRFEEAKATYHRALEADPKFAGAWNGLAVLFWQMGRHEQALAAYDKAIELFPDYAEAHFNKAVTLLTLGRFAQGCAEYEWREKAGKTASRSYQRPRWNGEKINGSLLVWGEQGVGDHILYSSLLPEALGYADEVIIETDARLTPLLQRSFPKAKVIALESDLYSGRVDRHVPMGGLVRYLRKDFSAFPRRSKGYLVPDKDHVARLRKRFGEGAPVIGLSWHSKNQKLGHHKSAELMDFEPVLRMPNIRFVDLQYGDTAAERREIEAMLGVKVEHMEDIDNMNDLDGLAALVAACDGVLTVSNTTAHLAGAVGAQTWVMVPSGTSRLWYWFEDRSDSPWYPQVRVVRRAPETKWSDLIATLALEIRQSSRCQQQI